MTPQEALDQIAARAQPGKAAEKAAYHKVDRPYLGTANPEVDALCKEWRAALTVADRVELARGLWESNVHEGRIAAAKLLTQARLRPDEDAWALIQGWLPDCDAWAIADQVCTAAQKRIMADLSRLDAVEDWLQSPNLWVRRAALVATEPLAKLNFPKGEERAARARVLGWAASLTADRDWFIQKAIAGWLRDLSRHDAEAARRFLDTHGEGLKAFARKEAAQYLG